MHLLPETILPSWSIRVTSEIDHYERIGCETATKRENATSIVMPQNGERNSRFGFFRSQCCGKEIVVPKGSEFPGCPNHLGVPTIWESVVDHNIVQLINRRKIDPPMPRFSIGDQVIVGVGRDKGKSGKVAQLIQGAIDSVHRYDVQLNDGNRIRCFGFELELLIDESAKSA